jgi:tetratricopeptide (TPR) repeat protein
LRLAGQVGTALEVIEAAILKHGTIPTLLVTRAMTLLALGLNALCQKDLDNAVPLANVNSQHLAIVARAELELRAGNNQKAHDLLQEIPLNTLQMREESRAFANLFALLESQQPMLEYVTQTKVEITALGVLQVKVNQRLVPIPPTSRIGELLVFILEQGGTASLEQITDALYADALSELEQNRARKAIWKLTRDLRLALGWQNSIASLQRAYQLDPNAVWDYDAWDKTVKAKGFLSGIYSNWVLEISQKISH